MNLPGWFGVGTGLAAAREEHGDDAVARAASDVPLLATLLENVAMSLAKTDASIAGEYLALGERSDLADLVLAERERSVEQVLAVTGHPTLLADRRVLSLRGGPARPLRRRPVPPAAAGAAGPARRRGRPRPQPGAEGAYDDGRRDRLLRLVLLTAGGVAAGLQNTG